VRNCRLKISHRYLHLFFIAFSLAPVAVQAQQGREIRVMISGGFSAAYDELIPQFEAAQGVRVVTTHGPSLGESQQAIPNRIARGEAADVVILADSALDKLIQQDKVIPTSKTDLARSFIAMAVREGAPLPLIGNRESLAKTLVDAKSIAVSASASGVYVATEMYRKLGIESQVKDKSRVIRDEPVGKVVARGDVEIGFQQLSELKPVRGITIVGLIPADMQKVTVFSAGLIMGGANEQGGRELIRFLSSAAVKPVIQKAGMEPVMATQ
jgi:molybdate transport system substrate-binding protein